MPTPKKPAKGKSKKAAPVAAPAAPVLSAKERMRLAALSTASAPAEAPQPVVQSRQSTPSSIDLRKKRAFSDLDVVEQVFGDDLDGLDEDDN